MALRSEMNWAVSGRICISPYAPLDDSTSSSNPLSVKITAATRAGSTPFSSATIRIVSSYWSGCVIRRTVSGAFRRKGSTRRKRTRATSRTAPRLRLLRNHPYLRLFGSSFALGTLILTEHPLHEVLRLLPHIIQIPVVLYHHVRAQGLLFS